MKLSTDVVVSLSDDHIASNLSQGVIILQLRSGVYYGLDGAGARVWDLLREPRTIGDLAEGIQADFEVDEDQCLDDVGELVSALAERGLVELRYVDPA